MKNIKAFIIVIKDDPTSEYYYNYVKDSWESNGIELTRFDAYTPDTYESLGLKFGDRVTLKYTRHGIFNKEYSPKERAALCSHYAIWKMMREEFIHEALIIEHDAFLKDPELFKELYKSKADVKLFGQGASCYRMNLKASWRIMSKFDRSDLIVVGGPMAYIAPQGNNSHTYPSFKYEVSFDELGNECHLPVSHVFNKDIGNTINDKYDDLDESKQQIFKDKDNRRCELYWEKIK